MSSDKHRQTNNEDPFERQPHVPNWQRDEADMLSKIDRDRARREAASGVRAQVESGPGNKPIDEKYLTDRQIRGRGNSTVEVRVGRSLGGNGSRRSNK